MTLTTKIAVYFFLTLAILKSTIAMNTAPQMTTDNSTLSSQFDSEIASSKARINVLSHQANLWNRWYLGMLVFSVLLVAGTVLCQFFAIEKRRDISNELDNLLHLNDLKAAADSRAKDEAIGRLKKDAATLESKDLKLEAILAPRRLNDVQQAELAKMTFLSGREVEIQSYTLDVEGMVLATQIGNGLAKAKLHIRDNRMTMQPAGSISFGILIEGRNKSVVEHLRKILSSRENDLLAGSGTTPSRNNIEVTVRTGLGVISGPEPAATITVGVKPLRK